MAYSEYSLHAKLLGWIAEEIEHLKTNRMDWPPDDGQRYLIFSVSTSGYPLAMRFIKATQFEGDSMHAMIDLFKRKCKLQNLVIVADAELLSNKNIEALQQNHCQYILGERIKN